MTTEITTSFTIDVEQHDEFGHDTTMTLTVVPKLSVVEKHRFESDTQALRYHDDLGRWLKEFPLPFRGISPKWGIAPTEGKLLAILDEIHGPDELWHD